jgi:hypothetical protein
VPVFVASKRLAYVVQAGLYISVFGMIVFLLVPVGMHKHSNPGSFLVESGLGISGWSTGTAWVLSISNSMYAFGATDGGQLSPWAVLTWSSYPYQRGDVTTWTTSASSHYHDHGYWAVDQFPSLPRSHVLHDGPRGC